MPKFLVVFAQKHEDFRLPELDSVLVMLGIASPRACYDIATYSNAHPFLEVELPSCNLAARIVQRAILVKRVYELWTLASAAAGTPGVVMDALVERMHAINADSAAFGVLATDASKTWSLDVKAFGRKLSAKEQQALRMRFAFLPFAGRVRLKGADNVWTLVLSVAKVVSADVRPSECAPVAGYFCRLLGDGITDASGARRIIDLHDLKKRAYLGPTSMDAELSLVMANMGLVRPGTVCLDPYVGTGSLLVACSQFGAFCMGSDIDHRVLRGKGEGRTMRDNFKQYNLTVPEIIRADLSPAGAAGLRMWAPRLVRGADGAAEARRAPPTPLIDRCVYLPLTFCANPANDLTCPPLIYDHVKRRALASRWRR